MGKKLKAVTVSEFLRISGHTQSSLSRHLDCTSATISSWVRGISSPVTHYRRVLLEVMAEYGYTLKEK